MRDVARRARPEAEQLFCARPGTDNHEDLRRRITYMLQEEREGGLSDRAIERLPSSCSRPAYAFGTPDLGILKAELAAASTLTKERAPGWPASGTVILRLHDCVDHRVTVLDTGLESQGILYRSLSKIIKPSPARTGTSSGSSSAIRIRKDRDA